MTSENTNAPARRGPHLPAALRNIGSNPYLLLLWTMMLWGGNGTAARLAAGAISPMLLVFLRWVIVCTILLALFHRAIRANLPVLRANWASLLLLSFCGMTGLNTFYYLAAYGTSALNLTLLQCTTPVIVLIGAVLFQGARAGPLQIIGMAVSFVAIGLVAAHGDLRRLSELSFGSGDILALISGVMNAIFTLLLRRRPAVPAIIFFAGMAFAALAEAVPLAIVEFSLGRTYWPTTIGWVSLFYTALGPAFLAQLAFMRSIELIGPARCGLFTNLVPVFGALFAVVIVGETFAPYHGVALVLALGGIYLAEQRRR